MYCSTGQFLPLLSFCQLEWAREQYLKSHGMRLGFHVCAAPEAAICAHIFAMVLIAPWRVPSCSSLTPSNPFCHLFLFWKKALVIFH